MTDYLLIRLNKSIVSKLAYVREKLSGLSKDQFEEVLQLFSFLSFFEEKFIFPSNYLTDKLQTIKAKKKTLNFDNDKLIEDLQIAIGILNKEGLDYTFPHRSLQEYFAALYISKLSQENKTLIYNKLKESTEVNLMTLMNKDHFYGLLTELDYNNLNLMVSIPLVKKLVSELKTIESMSNEIAYKYYGKILVIFHFLLKTTTMHKEIHNEFIDSNIQYMYLGKGNDDFELPSKLPKYILDEMNFDLMRLKVLHFKTNGERIIKSLVKVIEDNEKSDNDIINLI